MVFWAGCPDQGPVIVTEHARALGARAGMAPVFPAQDTLTPRPDWPCHAQALTRVQGSLQPSPANTVQWLLLADRGATAGWGLRGVLGRACITKKTWAAGKPSWGDMKHPSLGHACHGPPGVHLQNINSEIESVLLRISRQDIKL